MAEIWADVGLVSWIQRVVWRIESEFGNKNKPTSEISPNSLLFSLFGHSFLGLIHRSSHFRSFAHSFQPLWEFNFRTSLIHSVLQSNLCLLILISALIHSLIHFIQSWILNEIGIKEMNECRLKSNQAAIYKSLKLISG